MGLKSDIGTVLIVCELRGSSAAIGIRMVVFAAELALNNISHCNTKCFIAGSGWIGLIFLFERDGFDVPVMGLISINYTVSIEYCAGFSSTSILETCHKHETKIINRADRYWDITASGHLVENGNPIRILILTASASSEMVRES